MVPRSLIYNSCPWRGLAFNSLCSTLQKMEKKNIPSKESLEDLLQLFKSKSGLKIFTEVPLLPEAGFSYIFEWTPESRNRIDWRSDGYRWVKDAIKSVTTTNGVEYTKYYFKSQIENENITDSTFQRRAIECSRYPYRVLVRYLSPMPKCFPMATQRVIRHLPDKKDLCCKT